MAESGQELRERSVWSGEWVARRLDVELVGDPDAPDGPDSAGTARLKELLGLALRRNPKRAHLLVSNVLGKHVPTAPSRVHGAGLRLGAMVRELLGAPAARQALVLGYAETATGLGHSVADGIGAAAYLHSTRRPVEGVEPVGGFEEEHSHATSHLLLPEDPELLGGDRPLVLVDDELSTGRTVRNTLRTLHARQPRERYVIAALVDMRDSEQIELTERLGAELGATIETVALAAGRVRLPDGVLARGAELVAAEERRAGGANDAAPDGAAPGVAAREAAGPAVRRIDIGWPLGLPDGGRHGFTDAHRARLDAELPVLGGRLAEQVRAGLVGSAGSGMPSEAPARVLVLGFEELMYAPLRLAGALEQALEGEAVDVRFSTTTRSPVLAVDDPGYAIRTRLSFPSHDAPADGPGPRFAYNATGFDLVVLVVDDTADTAELHAPGGLLSRLDGVSGAVRLVVLPSYRPNAQESRLSAQPAQPAQPVQSPQSAQTVLPEPLRGPAFSSYPAADVGWLLTDLSDVTLEAPVEEREEAIQAGGAHYAESLPIEYQPDAAYQRLFRSALDASAARIAHAVGVVTELVLAERGRGAVLASLARAGTPVGVLMRRWAETRHGLDLPHYAVSIVRGRGIDPVALRYLAARHNPADVVFVDGWTGKGAITRELAEGLLAPGVPAGFDPALAVLADPGGCVSTYGTREDFLIPSACLNSTVSGLISRTVLRSDLIGPNTFHGAKFYRELAGTDVSGDFLDAVVARFDEVATAVERDAKELAGQDRAPTWAGWAAVERISEEYGIGDVNLVKPGVGETTRVLLRRVPWRVLARRGAGADLDHVRMLAEQRGAPVEEVDELPYSCVGLIHPRFTRGAVGADGTGVTA